MRLFKPSISCLLIGLCAFGCQTSRDPAVQRSEMTVTLLVETRAEVLAGEQKVENAQSALRTLGDSNGDLRKVFDNYATMIEIVRAEAERMRQTSAQVKTTSDDYCARREAEVKTIANDDMRSAAEERALNVRKRFDRISEAYTQANASYSQYVRNLDDLETYLANELNFPALQSAGKWISDTLDSGKTLKTNLQLLANELGTTSNVLSPIPVPTTYDQQSAGGTVVVTQPATTQSSLSRP